MERRDDGLREKASFGWQKDRCEGADLQSTRETHETGEGVRSVGTNARLLRRKRSEEAS